MKRVLFGTLLAVFLFATSALVASAATIDGIGHTGTAAALHSNLGPSLNLQSGARTTALFLIAVAQPADHTAQSERQDEKEKDRGKGKDKFHGAEMGSTAIVLAGVFAISAYFLFVRRKAQKHV
jgi:hypothetical protein